MRRWLWALAIGVVAGLAMPMPPIATHLPDAPTLPHSAAEERTERSGLHAGDSPPSAPACVSDEVLAAARARAHEATGNTAMEAAAFAQDWGTPLLEPQGWDPEQRRYDLEQAMDSVGAAFGRVDCSFYPCVVLLAFVEEPVSEEIAAAFGARFTVSSSSGSGRGLVFIETLAPEVSQDVLDQGQSRWVSRLESRLLMSENDAITTLGRAADE